MLCSGVQCAQIVQYIFELWTEIQSGQIGIVEELLAVAIVAVSDILFLDASIAEELKQISQFIMMIMINIIKRMISVDVVFELKRAINVTRKRKFFQAILSKIHRDKLLAGDLNTTVKFVFKFNVFWGV